jgi:N-acyl homoserine lactone hydrolase
MAADSTDIQRLYLMEVAYLTPGNLPVVCYLMQTGDGKHIMIDSGISEKPELPEGMGLIPGINVIDQLAMLGLQPRHIDMLICTHFDVDHSGYQSAFTSAEYVVQRSHYVYAFTSEHCAPTRPQWDQPPSRYRFLNGDAELLPGLTAIETSGHVPGHQSVLVRLPQTGAVLLTIDAVSSQKQFIPHRQVTGSNEDALGVLGSTLKLLDIAQREKASLVVFGHDADQWGRLKKAPEYYR